MGTFGVYVVVQFYPWFNSYFLLFQTHYHTIPYPKTKQNVKWLNVDTVISNESVLLTFGECAACNTASSTFPSSNNWNENNNSFSKKNAASTGIQNVKYNKGYILYTDNPWTV